MPSASVYRCGMAATIATKPSRTLSDAAGIGDRGRHLRRVVRGARGGGRPEPGPGVRDVDARVHGRVAVRVRRRARGRRRGARGDGPGGHARRAQRGLRLVARADPPAAAPRPRARRASGDRREHRDGAGAGGPATRRGGRSWPPASASGCAGTPARSPARWSAAGSATRARSASTRCSPPRSWRCWRRSCAARARPSPRSPGAMIAVALLPFAPAGVPVIAALAGVVPGVLVARGVKT